MTGQEVTQVLLALGVGAVVAELIRSGFQRRKMSADAAKVITDAATVLLGPLQERVRELEGEVRSARQELDAARRTVAVLNSELDATRTDLARFRRSTQEER